MFCKTHFFIEQVSICPLGYKNSPVIFCDKQLLVQLQVIFVVSVQLNNFIIIVLHL